MSTSPISGFEEPYELYRRFEALIESIFALNATVQQLRVVRYKPLFGTYESCMTAFRSSYPAKHDQLGLEVIGLYDDQGKEQFTLGNLSTVLHQSQAVVGVLKGLLPPALVDHPSGTTLIVSTQANSVAAAEATARIEFAGLMDGLAAAIRDSDLDEQSKDDLVRDVHEVKDLADGDVPRVKAFAGKLIGKLLEVGEKAATDLFQRWLMNQMSL